MAKTKRPRQGQIPGTEPPRVQEVEEAADTYVAARDERMRLLKDETKLADRLLFVMREHSLRVYEFDGQTVSLDTTEKVRVRRKKEGGEDGEENGDA